MKNLWIQKNISLLMTPMLIGLSLNALAVSGTVVPNSFTAGTTATAADVNANFDALETGVNTLESSVSTLQNKLSGGVTNLTVDCSADANALQTAVDTSAFGTLDIDVSGSCNPIAITRDHVKISTSSSATITSDGSAPHPTLPIVAAVVVLGAQNVSIDGIALVDDGSDSAALGLGSGASVTLSNSSLTGTATERYALDIFSNSTLYMSGGVSISGDSGASVEQSSSLIAFGTGNSITATNAGYKEALKVVGGSVAEFNEAITLTGSIEVDTAYLRGENLTVTGTAQITNGGTLDLRGNGGNPTHSLGALELLSKSSATVEDTSISGNVEVYNSTLFLESGSSVTGTTDPSSVGNNATVAVDATSSIGTTTVRQSSIYVDGTVGNLDLITFSSAVIGFGDGAGAAATATSGITVTDSNLIVVGTTDLGSGTVETKTPTSTARIGPTVVIGSATLTCTSGTWLGAANPCI